MKVKIFLSMILVIVLSACTGVEPPNTLVTKAEALIEQAERADASDYAPEQLRDAKLNLSEGKSAIINSDYGIAEMKLQRAIADAEYALARSNAQISVDSAIEINKNLSAFEKQIDQQ